jgi:hypothetical protein
VAKYAEYQAGTLEEACIGDESARRFKWEINFGAGMTRLPKKLNMLICSVDSKLF